MAEKKKTRRRRNNGFTIPIAVVAGFLPGIIRIYEAWAWRDGGGWSNAIREAGMIYLAWDWWEARFRLDHIGMGLLPIIAGVLVHRIVGNRMSINRALRNSGVPIIRL